MMACEAALQFRQTQSSRKKDTYVVSPQAKQSFLMAFKNQGCATRALVIEDIKVDCVILLRMLQKLNCEATVARNGKEAIDLFLQGKTFDIVFSHQEMSVMTGPEAVTKIRAMGATEVTIVGVSADFGGMEAFMRAGADAFVPKPLKLETLESMLQDVIHKKNMRG